MIGSGPSPTPPAGYSGTPLHRKLGVRPGHRVLAVGMPAGFPAGLLDADGTATLDTGPDLGASAPAAADIVLMFCPDVAALLAGLPTAMSTTAPKGRCWVAWPKRASKVRTDLTEDVVRDTALQAGWVDVKVCAIDAVWSGLCLMRRTRSATVNDAATPVGGP
jgi:hypothetical protein